MPQHYRQVQAPSRLTEFFPAQFDSHSPYVRKLGGGFSEVNMKEWFSLKNSFDLIFAIIAAISVIAVLYTFVIGRHYIIPSVILVAAVLFGNIAKYGFQDRLWAKQILFWSGFLFTGHAFFALFFAKIYRLWLGDAFEIICGIVVVVFGYLLFEYARRNQILSS